MDDPRPAPPASAPADGEVESPADRKRRLNAEAARRYRRRIGKRRGKAYVEYTESTIDGLIRERMLPEELAGDRIEVGRAIGTFVALHMKRR